MFKADNTIKMLIGKDIARTAGVQITDEATAATYIADGEVVVLGENHGVLTAGDTVVDSPKITIVQGRGAGKGLKFATTIDGRNLVKATALSYRAGAEQVTYIGSDGATGSIDVSPFTDYKLTITYNHDAELWAEQLNPRTFFYTTGASDTQQTIAQAFVDLINAEEYYNAAAVLTNNGADYGIELTGQPLEFELGDFRYNKMRFEVQLSGFGTTDLTYATDMDLGSGEYEQIAELEWFANGTHGVINRVHHPAPKGTEDAIAGETYDLLALEYFNTDEDYPVSGVKPAKTLLYIALPDTAAQTADILAQLNPWIASAVRPSGPLAV